MLKPLKIEFSIPFTSFLYKNFCFYKILFSSIENISKAPKHPKQIIPSKTKLNNL